MKRTFPVLSVAAAIACMAGVANAGSENATSVINLADLSLDFSTLPREPQTYTVRMQGKSFNHGQPFPFDSTFTMRTTHDGSNVVFNDTLEFAGRAFSFNLQCAPNATLTPHTGTISMDHTARTIATTLAHDEASHTMRITTGAGKANEIDYPKDTVTEAALFRIVSCLPRTPGAMYVFPAYCPLNEVRPQKPEDADRCTLTCLGPTTIEIDHASIPCTAYEANFEGNLTFFVDASSVVRQVMADFAQTAMTLTPTPGAGTPIAEAED